MQCIFKDLAEYANIPKLFPKPTMSVTQPTRKKIPSRTYYPTTELQETIVAIYYYRFKCDKLPSYC